jgi:hypothetical protein
MLAVREGEYNPKDGIINYHELRTWQQCLVSGNVLERLLIRLGRDSVKAGDLHHARTNGAMPTCDNTPCIDQQWKRAKYTRRSGHPLVEAKKWEPFEVSSDKSGETPPWPVEAANTTDSEEYGRFVTISWLMLL